VAGDLEYLEEALEEAEAAARWYADRSLTAAAGFSEEIDAAEEAIAEFPEAWQPLVLQKFGDLVETGRVSEEKSNG
jgi:plasmid stabilization system protein ParE